MNSQVLDRLADRLAPRLAKLLAPLLAEEMTRPAAKEEDDVMAWAKAEHDRQDRKARRDAPHIAKGESWCTRGKRPAETAIRGGALDSAAMWA